VYTRDLRGYGATPPDPKWPGGARIAVSVVVNFEEGAEFSVRRGDPVNEAVYDMTDNVAGLANIAMESHFDYGLRVGYWRIARVLERHLVPATFSACGDAVRQSPWLAADAVARGHEVSCHGDRWESHKAMGEAEERRAIAATVEAITAATGVAPVGWHTRAPATPLTRRLLHEHGGLLYDSDAYDDDLPRVLAGPRGPHVVLPYSFDCNDMRFQLANAGFVTADQFERYVTDAFDWLWAEGATSPKMMSIGLHLRIVARPGRIGGLDRALAHMAAKGGVWFARRDQIARHCLETLPALGPTG
jgi:allantoinase